MPLDEHTAFHLANLFSALSDSTRLRIIAEQLGISESAVSHQLRGLRLQRIVRARKQGRQVFYCLDDEHMAELFRLGLKHMEHE